VIGVIFIFWFFLSLLYSLGYLYILHRLKKINGQSKLEFQCSTKQLVQNMELFGNHKLGLVDNVAHYYCKMLLNLKTMDILKLSLVAALGMLIVSF
jgi:hypothetical protein